MKSGLSSKSIKVFALPLMIAFAAGFQLMINGYPLGHDWIFELVRIVEYHEALSSGQGLPFWGGELYRGFGSPVFVFYAPLYAACASVLMMAGLTVTAAAITVLVLFAMTAAVGMAGLTRAILGKEKAGVDAAARVASVAFVLAPYFLSNMLVRNASAEFVALCLAPYSLWGLALIYKGNSRGLPVLAISFALVILAHNLTGLTMAAVLLAATLFLLLIRRRFDEFFLAIAAILIAVGLSCWFWLAALGLKEQVRIEEMLQGKFDFHNNFTAIGEMFAYDGLFAAGWFTPAILLIGAVVFIRGNRSPLFGSLLAAAMILVFLQTSASALVWEYTPLMPLFQFPWRMLGPLSLVAALISGLLFYEHLSHRRFAELVVIVLIAANALPLMQRYEPLSGEWKQFVAVSLNPRGIMQQGLLATVLDEYLPRAANKIVSERVPLGVVVLPRSGSVPAVVQEVSRTSIHLETASGKPGELHLARWYFPGWRATLDGVEHPVSADQFGAIKVNIPAGTHQVHLWLAQPALRQWGMLISGISVVVLALVLPAGRQFKNLWKNSRPPAELCSRSHTRD